ncbi:MAG TPA: MFS transporter [bacterium]
MRHSDRTIVLIAAAMSSFLTPFMGSAVTIALPQIGTTFGMNAVTLGWVNTAYLLSSVALLVPFGKLADIRGRKKIFMFGIGVYALFSFLTAFSPTSAFLIAFRAAQGAGGAMIFGTGVAMLSSVYPAGERGRALGINVAAVYLGLSLGPFIGGLMVQHVGWKCIFYVNGLLASMLLIFLALRLKSEWTGSAAETLDKTGSALYISTVCLLMIGFSKLPSALGWSSLAAGTAAMGAFLVWENQSPSPFLNLHLFRRNTVFAFSNLAALVNYCSTSAMAFLLSLYLQVVRGLEPRQAGFIMVSQPLIMTAFSPLAGRLSDRIEARVLASSGMAVNTLALILFMRLGANTPLWGVVLLLALLGFGLSFFSSPNTNAVMGSVDKPQYGTAASVLGTMRLTGQMLSMGIAMLVFSVWIGDRPVTEAVRQPFLSAMRAAFGIFSLLSVVGVFASLARGKSGIGDRRPKVSDRRPKA